MNEEATKYLSYLAWELVVIGIFLAYASGLLSQISKRLKTGSDAVTAQGRDL